MKQFVSMWQSLLTCKSAHYIFCLSVQKQAEYKWHVVIEEGIRVSQFHRHAKWLSGKSVSWSAGLYCILSTNAFSHFSVCKSSILFPSSFLPHLMSPTWDVAQLHHGDTSASSPVAPQASLLSPLSFKYFKNGDKKSEINFKPTGKRIEEGSDEEA